MTVLIAEIERTTHLIFAHLFWSKWLGLSTEFRDPFGFDLVCDKTVTRSSHQTAGKHGPVFKTYSTTPILCEKGAQAFFL